MSPLKKRDVSDLVESDFEHASEFNGKFTDVFTKTEYSPVPPLNRKAPFMEGIDLSKEGDKTSQKFQPVKIFRS